MNTKELFFDDDLQDFQNMLYKNSTSPTPANLSFTTTQFFKEIETAYEIRNMQAFCGKLVELVENRKLILSKTNYEKICGYLSKLIPDQVKPNMDPHAAVLGPVIEKTWKYIQKNNSYNICEFCHRWFEYFDHYDRAIGVLKKYINWRGKNHQNFHIQLNNMAYDYYLKGDWETAIPLFREAAEFTSGLKNNELLHINALVNMWLCKIETIAPNSPELAQLEDEINSIQEKKGKLDKSILMTGDYWHTRKPFILKAKIEEKKGNYREAIAYVEQAIENIKTKSNYFLNNDTDYKNFLESHLKESL